MGTLTLENRSIEYQWATDVSFDGIRLEVLSDDGEMLFDVSIPDGGPTTVNTFGMEVLVDVMKLAIELAERR